MRLMWMLVVATGLSVCAGVPSAGEALFERALEQCVSLAERGRRKPTQ